MKNKVNKHREKCFVKGTGGTFGSSDFYDHQWRYMDKELRKCEVCTEVERYFGIKSYNGWTEEDWRPAYE